MRSLNPNLQCKPVLEFIPFLFRQRFKSFLQTCGRIHRLRKVLLFPTLRLVVKDQSFLAFLVNTVSVPQHPAVIWVIRPVAM